MKVTWLSHSAFRVEIAGAVVMIDPFLTGNPAFKGNAKTVSAGATHILLTHGHDDHIGDAVAIAKKTGAQIVANYEICMFLAGQGAKNINPGNTGGTVDCGPFSVSFTPAVHSSGTTYKGKSIYLGNPNGLILKAQGEKVLYHMGDTDIFSDMALINEIHRPKIGLVPIGDRFTMGPQTAALAVKRFFRFQTVVPMHFGTFPLLTGQAGDFKKALKGAKTAVRVPEFGQAMAF